MTKNNNISDASNQAPLQSAVSYDEMQKHHGAIQASFMNSMGDPNASRMGKRMVAAGLITEVDCDQILHRQYEYHVRGLHFRFGEVAILEGLCTRQQVENLPGFIGERLLERGFITQEQRDKILEWQYQLKEKNIFLRFGDIAVNEGFVQRETIERLLVQQH